MAIKESRLGIPLLLIEEGTHGVIFPGATIYPEGPALGSTWNMDLVGEIYSQSAHEARAVGTHVLNTIVIEPIRDPRLGRNEEAYTEDPYLSSCIAGAIVKGRRVYGDVKMRALKRDLFQWLCWTGQFSRCFM